MRIISHRNNAWNNNLIAYHSSWRYRSKYYRQSEELLCYVLLGCEIFLLKNGLLDTEVIHFLWLLTATLLNFSSLKSFSPNKKLLDLQSLYKFSNILWSRSKIAKVEIWNLFVCSIWARSFFLGCGRTKCQCLLIQ